MPNITAAFANIQSPSVSLVEQTAGYRVVEIASHSAIYMIGSATIGPFNEPTLCVSLADFTNQFGGSLSEFSVKLLFRNDPEAKLFFVRAGIATEYTVTIDAAAETDYTLTVNGATITYAADLADDDEAIAEGLRSAINASSVAASVSAFTAPAANQLRIRPDVSTTALAEVVATAGAATITNTTPVQPQSADFISAIENSFDQDEGWAQGFLICPQGFQQLSSPTDRLALGSAMESFASDKAYDWKAFVDVGSGVESVAGLKEEGERYVSPQGHTDFFAPYVKDLEGEFIPASAGVAAMATRMYRERGYHQPFAGALYPLQGVTDVERRYGRQEQDVLNPIGINLIRFLRNKGVCVWGMRTRSADPFYRFSVTRVIFNVLNGTLRDAFDFELFASIDDRGVLLGRIKDTALSVCRRMWKAGALFGATEQQAFEVKCSFENNSSDNLELGQVIVEVYAAPSPALEKLLVATFRTNIGAVQSAASSGVSTVEAA